jgi:hypothetical protein
MRTALFCFITQRVVVIPYRRFGTTYRSHLLRFLTLKMGPICCPEMQIRNYYNTQRNNPRECSCHWLHCCVSQTVYSKPYQEEQAFETLVFNPTLSWLVKRVLQYRTLCNSAYVDHSVSLSLWHCHTEMKEYPQPELAIKCRLVVKPKEITFLEAACAEMCTHAVRFQCRRRVPRERISLLVVDGSWVD